MEHPSTIHVGITVESAQVPVFYQLLSQGFRIKVRLGFSVKEFLCRKLGLDLDYIEQRIQTVFLNGKVVDDINAAMVTQGVTLALSAAMPGLVGATFRRSGRYSSLRNQLSHENDTIPSCDQDGEVTLKLFNLVARETGSIFLRDGILIWGKDFEGVILQQPDDFWASCKSFSINGQQVDRNKLSKVEWKDNEVFLKLRIFGDL
jgi:hypothetical protein